MFVCVCVIHMDTYDSRGGPLNIFPKVSEVFLYALFFFFSTVLHLFCPFYILSRIDCLCCVSVILLLVPSRVFFISVIVLIIMH